jgi:hypothetical protein
LHIIKNIDLRAWSSICICFLDQELVSYHLYLRQLVSYARSFTFYKSLFSPVEQ